MLKKTFTELLLKYTDNQNLITSLWFEIEKNYSKKKRYYHNLSHLENLMNELDFFKEKIEDLDTLLFSIYYHDIIYNVLKKDNEEKSALLAVKNLELINFPNDKIEKCKNNILATKSHQVSDEYETNFFTDLDLSILGQEWDIYLQYSIKIRKEYSIYPDILYIPGRKKILNSFLSMERIFKTDIFYNKFESNAKNNIKKELEELSKT
ncbi:MAG: hypothetical protein AABZ74_10280 [Cyanobacteriota bacterium]